MKHLERKDLSLTESMIPLGSCTMKLNSTTSMMGLMLEGFGKIHPFAPQEQTKGYDTLLKEMEEMLAEIEKRVLEHHGIDRTTEYDAGENA